MEQHSVSTQSIQFITYDEAIAASKKEPGVNFIGIRFDKPYRRVECYFISTDADEPDYVNIHYQGGLMFSSSGEEEFYCEEEVPAEAKNIFYARMQDLDYPNLSDTVGEYVLYEVLPRLNEPESYLTNAAFVAAAIREFTAFWWQPS